MTNIVSIKGDVQEGVRLDFIPLFLDFYDRYSKLSYEERGRLVWAMLAYARGEDPVPHLTGELRRFCFPNERNVIDRTAKEHQERRQRRRAASQVANAAKYNHSESEPIGVNLSDSEHNNNYNYNNNNNNNNNHNN